MSKAFLPRSKFSGKSLRSNLKIMTNSQVSRIEFEGTRAVGVRLMSGELISADKEVVLSTRSIGSTQLL